MDLWANYLNRFLSNVNVFTVFKENNWFVATTLSVSQIKLGN